MYTYVHVHSDQKTNTHTVCPNTNGRRLVADNMCITHMTQMNHAAKHQTVYNIRTTAVLTSSECCSSQYVKSIATYTFY